MKLSTRARYALRAMISIARAANQNGPISLERVSKNTKISRRYLEQLAIALKNASLLRSVSGRGGGYFLARAANEITLLEIVEASIGPIGVVDCTLRPEDCAQASFCECRDIYCQINDKIDEVLKSYTLQDLAAGFPGREGAGANQNPCSGGRGD